jgi:hypothetical protein
MKDIYRSFIVPAGSYWLGDPHDIFADDPHSWLEYVRACAKADIQLNGHYESFDSGPPILSFRTMCGPGEYKDHTGNEYISRTGLLGLVPVDYKPAHEGKLIVFDAEMLCFTKDGILTFGNHIIDTAKECAAFEAYEI